MTKKLTALMPIVVVMIVAGAALVLYKKNPAVMTAETDTQQALPSTKSSLEGDPQMSQGGEDRYVLFTPETLTSQSETRRVLFFYANWCPTCIPVDKDFQRRKEAIPSNVTLIRVNYNDDATDATEEELARKYDITYQHTFVEIDNQGNAIKRWNGGGLDELLSQLTVQN